MKILMLSHYFYPKIGGVEKVVKKITENLSEYKISIVTQRYDKNLKQVEKFNSWTTIYRFTPLKIKYVGLFSIWVWIYKNRFLIKSADVIHIHDVFIWYLPFKIIYPSKKVYITYHGWEGKLPIPIMSLVQKKVGDLLAHKTVAVGKYLENLFWIKSNLISYNGTDIPRKISTKKNKIVYLGRLSNDTGIPLILEVIQLLDNVHVDFYGDGELRDICGQYGTVHGFISNPEKVLKNALICFAGGYLATFEGMANKCLVCVALHNDIRYQAFTTAPFHRYIISSGSSKHLATQIRKFIDDPITYKTRIDHAYNWVKNKTWEKLADDYRELWRN